MKLYINYIGIVNIKLTIIICTSTYILTWVAEVKWDKSE